MSPNQPQTVGQAPGSIRPGETAVVCGFEGCADAEHALRRIGLREGVEIEWVAGCSPVLIRCDRAHIAICPKLLEGVRVLRLPCCARATGCACAGGRRRGLLSRFLGLFPRRPPEG